MERKWSFLRHQSASAKSVENSNGPFGLTNLSSRIVDVETACCFDGCGLAPKDWCTFTDDGRELAGK